MARLATGTAVSYETVLSVNKRKLEGLEDIERTAIYTVETGTTRMEEDEDNNEITESKDRNTEIIDTTMTDNEHTTTGLQEQEETTTSRNTTSTTAGDFNHQFKLHTTRTNMNTNTPTGVNRQ
jgi:hypothetical protein